MAAFGVPVVTTQRGMLPEIVAPAGRIACGITGKETAEALGGAPLALLGDDERRRGHAQAALRRARVDMDPAAAAAALASFYGRLLALRAESRR